MTSLPPQPDSEVFQAPPGEAVSGRDAALNALIKAEAVPVQVNGATKDEAQELFGDDARQEALKEALHVSIVWGLRLAAMAVILCFLVRVIHMLVPESWTWLAPERLQKIDNLLFSGALGAMITRYLNQILPAEKEKK